MKTSPDSENKKTGSSLKVKTKVMGTVMFCIMLLVTVSSVAVWQMVKIGEEIGEVVSFDLPVTEALTKTTVHHLEQAINFERSVRYGEEMVTLTASRAGFRKSVRKFGELGAKVDGEVAEAAALITDAQKSTNDPEARALFQNMIAVVGQITSSFKDYNDSAAKIHKLLADGRVSAIHDSMPRIEALEEGLEHDLEKLLLEMEKFTIKALAKAHQHEKDAIFWMIAISVMAIIAGTVIGFWVVQSAISRPLASVVEAVGKLGAGDLNVEVAKHHDDEIGQVSDALQMFKETALERKKLEAETGSMRVAQEQAAHAVAEALGALAEGDLTVRIHQDLEGDYGKIKSDFNAALDKLQKTVSRVSSGADGIRSGTSEIAQASDDMSRRTENQAATLEETAAAVGEITSAVQSTAEAALEASSIVSGTKQQAEQGSEIVRTAIDAMGGIEKSSKEISDITNVIDEIAYQTNLLALNAGVEAARAGDAGRGFAVVASEVRALAQRSAGAAKQIKDLISNSSSQVANGVGLVQKTGTALESIEAGVGKVNQVVNDISASAKDQATGLAEVNTAVAQLDQVTQQNAAMVEQATAATKALADQGGELAQLVGQFQTEGGAQGDALRAELEQAAPHVFQEAPAAPQRPPEPEAKAAAIPPPAQKLATGTDDGWEEF